MNVSISAIFFIAQKIKVNYYDEFLKLHKYFKK